MIYIPVIMFNGPPGSGKDTGVEAICATNTDCWWLRFGSPLKMATHALYGGIDLLEDHFEATKDVPCDFFLGLAPRQAYIMVAEMMAKRVLGEDFFARVLLSRVHQGLTKHTPSMIIISDLGFKAEAETIIKAFGVPNVLIVRIHAEKRGCTFEGDSRSYVSGATLSSPVTVIDVENNVPDDTSKYEAHLLMHVRAWLNGRTMK